MLPLRYKILLALALLSVQCYATTLTGTINTPAGAGLNGTLILSLSQQGALVSTGGCGGPAQLVPNVYVKITVTAGALVSPPAIYGNDCMLPSNLYYVVQVIDAQGNTLMQDRWVIAGSTTNVGTIVSVVTDGTTTQGSSGIVQLQPLTNQTIQQPVGTTLTINTLSTSGGTFTLPDGSVCTSGGCSGASFANFVNTTTTQSIGGLKTFTQLVSANGAWPNGYIGPIFNGNVTGLTGSGVTAQNTFTNSDGSYHVTYQGNMYGQSLTLTNGMIVGGLSSIYGYDGSGNAVALTNISQIFNGSVTGTQYPVGCSTTIFLSNTCATFVNSDRSFAVDYKGNIAAQTVIVTSTYNSDADVNCGAYSGGCSSYGTALTAFQDSSGSFKVLGDGSTWTSALHANTVTSTGVYNVGSSPGVTSTTCSQYTGGICTAP